MGATSKKQPLYGQLVDSLREKIETEYEPGDLLPSERELSEDYCISRTTVRLALKELETLGFIKRRHGKGTFVADRSQETTNLTRAYSFSEQMRSLGRIPRSELLEFRSGEASKTVADRMGLAAGERVISMRRLRLADDVPMLIEHTYLPGKIFSGLTSDEVDSRSLYKIMAQDYHIEVRVAEEEFYASVARREEARLLGISEGAPVLQLFRLTYNTRNQVVEFTKGVARADQFHYKVSYYGGSSA